MEKHTTYIHTFLFFVEPKQKLYRIFTFLITSSLLLCELSFSSSPLFFLLRLLLFCCCCCLLAFQKRRVHIRCGRSPSLCSQVACCVFSSFLLFDVKSLCPEHIYLDGVYTQPKPPLTFYTNTHWHTRLYGEAAETTQFPLKECSIKANAFKRERAMQQQQRNIICISAACYMKLLCGVCSTCAQSILFDRSIRHSNSHAIRAIATLQRNRCRTSIINARPSDSSSFSRGDIVLFYNVYEPCHVFQIIFFFFVFLHLTCFTLHISLFSTKYI